MAAGNLYVVANRVLGSLRSEDIQGKIGSVCGTMVLDQLLGLEKTMSLLAPLLLHAEKKASRDNRIIDWLMRLEEELCDVDNMMEQLATEALAMRRSQLSQQVCSFFSTCPAFRLDMHQKMKDMKYRLDELEGRGRKFGLEESRDRKIQFPDGVMWETRSFIVEARDIDKMEVIRILLGMKFKQNVMILPILGTKQLETTTLARDVFNDGRVRRHFHSRIWLHHSGIVNDMQILNEIIAHVNPFHQEETDIKKLIKLLKLSLSDVRYLIVLDASIGNPEELHFLSNYLRIGKKGSKIILTSSNANVTSITGTIQPYSLNRLTEDQLWSLFETVAFRQQRPKTSYMIEIGKKIVKECLPKKIVKEYARLPLVVTAIGSMLYFDNSEDEWRFFYKNEISRVGWGSYDLFPFALGYSSDYVEILPLLKLCYDHLPSPLKHCFAYCSLFPKRHEIDVQTIIKLWMAQGFIEQIPVIPSQSLEDVGYEYILNLLRRCFFQEPTVDARGRVIKCKMHDSMHDLATLVARKQCIIFSPDASPQQVVEASHVSFGSGFFSAEVSSYFHPNKTRSFLLQSQLWGKYKRIQDIHEIFDAIISRYRSLRALDMRASGIKIVPPSIGELKLMKYLDLSENDGIMELPDSITKLLNLQTLRLSSCFRLRRLPRDIQSLVNLRHLEIDGCNSLTSLTRRFGQLTHLQTLPQIVLSKDPSMCDVMLNEVKELGKLREDFQIKNLRHEEDVATYLNVVPHGVRFLSLEWDIHVPGEPPHSETSQNNLSSKLQELTINGFSRVTLLHQSFSFSGRLVKLSLKRCMNCRILPAVDHLRLLKVLALDENTKLEYISVSYSSSATFFLSLQEIWLTELPELKGWCEDGVDELPEFPFLSKLVIQDCPKLDSMPLFPTLEEGLVLDTTCWNPFKLTISNKASSSTSSSTTLVYPSLRELWLLELQGLYGWWKVRTYTLALLLPFLSELVTTDFSYSLLPTPKALSSPPLSKLKNLYIVGIDKLSDKDVWEIEWRFLESLRLLRLDCLPKLTTLPLPVLQIINLQELHIWRCGMKNIDGIEALQYLEKLVIRVCPHLESLPRGISSLKNLTTLEIEDCPTLIQRCNKKTGADWDKIAHIPKIHLGPISGR